MMAVCGLAGAATVADPVTPLIKGVVAAGTPVELVRDGYDAVEGPLPQPDGSLLFTNNRAHRIERLAPDGSPSVWWEGAAGANALTVTPQGEIASTLTEIRAIGIVRPGEAARVLVDAYDGKPFGRPNDLVASRRGTLYFTDITSPTAGANALPSAVYAWTPERKIVQLDTRIGRPNGVALSPDDRTLYVADTAGAWVLAYPLDRSGRPTGRREFARLALPPAPASGGPAPTGAGADGLAVDARGRLFVATTLGVQVFSARGEPLGVIPVPKQPQNLAFAGPRRSDLYIVGRGAVYRVHTATRGPGRAGK
jgi:gluconolactonase